MTNITLPGGTVMHIAYNWNTSEYDSMNTNNTYLLIDQSQAKEIIHWTHISAVCLSLLTVIIFIRVIQNIRDGK